MSIITIQYNFMKNLFIFDLDGMLIDSVIYSIRCFNLLFEYYGLPTYDKDLSDLDYDDFREFLRNNIDFSDQEVLDKFVEIYASVPEDSEAYEGIHEVLETLLNNGRTLAICSNREEENIKEDVMRVFPEINFKYISGYRQGIPDKPNPYRLNEIVEKEGISKDEVIYFGDKDVDILAAENAGIDMVVVKWGQGNDKDYANPYPLRAIDSPNDILDFAN
jgi:phosphoglycolate phosphatase